MTAIIIIALYTLGAYLLFKAINMDVLNTDGSMKPKFDKWEQYVGAIIWPVIMTCAVFDEVRKWIEAKRTRA